MSGPDEVSRRWRAAHRAALDHVLGLAAGGWWSGGLVLHGGVVLPRWLGDAARPPSGLDWVVVGFVDDPDSAATQYPPDWEIPAGDRADLARGWPRLEREVPVGYQWGWETEVVDHLLHPPYGDLLDALDRHPVAANGVVFDPAEAGVDDHGDAWADEDAGLCLSVPWRAPGLPPGRVRIDFSFDDRLPERPVPTAVPRADGGSPAVVLGVSRELSVVWTLLRMYRSFAWIDPDWDDPDWFDECPPWAAGGDLYDAVLLAEGCDRSRLPALLSEVWWKGEEHLVALDHIADWPVAWDRFRATHPWVAGTARDWLDRLAAAVPVPGALPPTSQVRGNDLTALAEHFNRERS